MLEDFNDFDEGPDFIDEREEWIRYRAAREAKVMLQVLKACGDNPEKQLRFLANQIARFRLTVDEHEQKIIELQELSPVKNEKNRRGKQKKKVS